MTISSGDQGIELACRCLRLDLARDAQHYRIAERRCIGVVLRDIYEREPDIPDDMAGLLRRINGRLQISR